MTNNVVTLSPKPQYSPRERSILEMIRQILNSREENDDGDNSSQEDHARILGDAKVYGTAQVISLSRT